MVGTRLFGFIAQVVGLGRAAVLAAGIDPLVGDRSSSQSQSTFITLLDLARPQIFSMAHPLPAGGASLMAAAVAQAGTGLRGS